MSAGKALRSICIVMLLLISVVSFATPDKPNIIVILADDLGWTDINCRPLVKDANEIDGYARVIPGDPNSNYIYDSYADATDAEDYDSLYYKTPNLSKLRSEGMRFTNAYAACAICAPTRASIMTGQYPARLRMTTIPVFRVNTDISSLKAQPLADEALTIPELLPEEYATACIGKWQLGSGVAGDPSYAEYQGFDLVVGGRAGMGGSSYFQPFDKTLDLTYANFRYFYHDSNGDLQEDPNWFKSPASDGTIDDGEYLTDVLTDEAIRFIKNDSNSYRDSNKPFFLHYSLYAVHDCVSGWSLETKQDDFTVAGDPGVDPNHLNQVYAGMIYNMDYNIGRLLATLEEEGIADDTIVIFLSDNGGSEQPVQSYVGRYSVKDMKYEGQQTDNAPLREGKTWIYEGGIRIPMIVKWPQGDIALNSTSDVPVSTIDILPTILDMAGVEQPDDLIVDGESLCPLLQQTASTTDRDALFWYFPHPFSNPSPCSAMVKRIEGNDYKLIHMIKKNTYELYNLTDGFKKDDVEAAADNLLESDGITLKDAANSDLLNEMIVDLYNWYSDVDAQAIYLNDRLLRGQLYLTFVDAIGAADAGDEIKVSSGKYIENITIDKDITLCSLYSNNPGYVEKTIIKGNGSDSVITAASDCTIEGLTITDGNSSFSMGGGINGGGHGVNVSNCIVCDNIAVYGGGIAECHGAISNCVIYDNTAQYGGGLDDCDGTIVNCTICDNEAGTAGGGGLGACNDTETVIANNIIWGNTPDQMFDCSTPNYSCIQSWNGGGTNNIISDPCFVDAGNSNYHLKWNSLCIDSGDDSSVSGDFDIDGEVRIINISNRGGNDGVDMGADEFALVYNNTQKKGYMTIQGAINEAVCCDEIVLSPVTYEENVVIDKKITLRSMDPDDPLYVQGTVIQGTQQKSVIRAESDCTIKGLTLTGGDFTRHDGTLVNFPTDDSQWITDDGHSCLEFDGTDDYVEISGYKGILGNAPRTCAAWIKADPNSVGYILSWGSTDVAGKWLLRIQWDDGSNPEGVLRLAISGTPLVGSTMINDDQWHHVAVTYNGSTLKLYVDGQEDASGAFTLNTGNDWDVEIGAATGQGSTDTFNGLIDDVCIYNQALDSTEIQQVKDDTYIPVNNLECCWKLDETSGDAVYDLCVSNGGGISANEKVVNVYNCSINGNLAFAGGGISGCHGTISNCEIFDNEAEDLRPYGWDGYGGGITRCHGTISNCLIYNNTSYRGGGLNNCDGTIVNCTIVYNTAIDGGGLRACDDPNTLIVNCIIWGNDSDQLTATCNTPIYSCIQDWAGGAEGNISSNPNFVNASNNDYHLLVGSPCVDAGDNSAVSEDDFDIDGQDRIMQKYVDMGVDETLPRVCNLTQDKWYPYIQDAIDDANDFDEIEVYRDTYYEQIDFLGKAITVRSTDPDNWDIVAATIIDVNDLTYGTASVTFDSNEDSNSVLSGFTLTGGDTGVGIYGTSYYEWGFTSPTVEKCIIENTGRKGIAIGNGSPTIQNNIIRDFPSWGMYIHYNGEAVVKNNLFYNLSTAIWFRGSTEGDVHNNTIVQNNCGISTEDGIPDIKNCIFWDNTSFDLGTGCSATYSCIEDGDAGTGNISSNPNFVNAANDDFHLSPDSPCIDAGDPNGVYTGQTDIDGDNRVIGSNVDMGADERNHLVAYWKLDGDATDTSSNGHDGILVNFPTDDSQWITEDGHSCLEFDGTDDYVEISGYKGIVGNAPRTCAAWINTTQVTGVIMSWGNTDNNWIMLINSLGKLKVEASGGYIYGSTAVNDGGWHHVAVVLEDDGSPNTSEAILYVDGQLETIAAFNESDVNTSGDVNVEIGAYTTISSPRYFEGSIDDVRIYDCTLSAAEIGVLAGQ